MWHWSVSASAPPPGTMMMWGISGIWKKRDNGAWQSAPNIFIDPAGTKGGTWLTYGDGDQNFPIDVKCSITYTLFGPGGSSQGSAETNTVTATPGNMVTHCTGGNALLILHAPGDEDPNTPGAEEHVLTWNAYHQDWCHSAFANEHMHCGISVLPVTGNPASPDWQITVPQGDPGDGSYTWEGQRTPPRPSAPKGIYTWLVSASHKYDPDGTGCPVGCGHVAECPPDTDKVGRPATVQSFEYLHLDPEANRLFVRVTYALATDVGECMVKVFTPSFDAVTWAASGDELTAGTHTTDVLEIEGVNDDQGNVVDGDEFCAVVLSSQTAAEGLLNRDRQPKPHVPHGMYGQAQTGSVTLESISFEDDIPMKWAVHPLDGNPVDLGNPEWTRADVRQDWKLLRPYCTCPRPYDFLPGSPSGACPNHGGAWSGPKRDPAAYVRPSKANRTNNVPLLVTLKGPAGATGTAWATGSLGGVMAFPVEFDSNGDATDQPAHTGAEVTDTVDVLGVNWSWHFQFDETAHQIALGDSEHTVYVTLDQRLAGVPVFLQLVDFSCRWADGGEAAAYVFDA
ncbi:MAG TPA: hypothetical protein PLQ54_03605, partial [Armatimonadota bacterium]|nr:hypothetical protein [Armatimonadota bacterium]